MAVQEEPVRSGGRAGLQPFPVNVRLKISALWAALLFVFAYIDLFSLYRSDVRAEIEAGEIGGFAIGEGLLLATTAYVVIPSLMVFGALVLRPGVNRMANMALGALYALTIVASAIGEWSYYVLGSAVEVVLLAGIVSYAWTWPRQVATGFAQGGDAAPRHGTVMARQPG